MIKIAYVVSTLKRSGPINILYNIVKYLDKNKFQIYIISLSPEKEDSRQRDFKELGCKILNLGLNRFEGIFKSKKNIIEIINDNKIKVIHSHGIRADFLISKLKEIRTFSTLHNYPYYDYPMTYGRIKGWVMAYFHLRCLTKIHNANVCSKSVSDMLKEKNNYDIGYVQNGVDLEKYSAVNKEIKEELREKLNLPIAKKVFISVGHLNDRKDPITIIGAFKKLNNSLLIFLGDGDLKDNCLKKIQNNPNIKLVGSVENVNEYLQASDYLISASKAEGLPNTVMEAMACGLPCILSNIPPHNEILNFDNKTGKVFEIGNSDDLINKINEIENQDYSEMSNSAIRLVKNNLSAKIMSEKYQELYLKMIKNI